MSDIATSTELDDIRTHFYAIMENYPTIYANFKANPDLLSARDAHAKTEAALTALHHRMFAFKSALEKALDENESAVGQLTVEGARLNATLARRTAVLNNKDAMMVPPQNKSIVLESFVTRQLPGCKMMKDPSDATKMVVDPTSCPCVEAGASTCSAKCTTGCPASSNQLSLVAEARDIEKRQYIYAIFRIIYLVVGIAMVSYFVYQTVGSPDSTILEDAKLKAEQLKTKLYGVGSGDVQQNERMNMERRNMERMNMERTNMERRNM
jgi:hypothetical protein